MPWVADYSSDGAEIRYYGLTTGADILEAKATFFGHHFANEPRYILCDFTGVAEWDLTPDDVQRIVRQDFAATASHRDLREVVIAPGNFEYGMARMWEMRVDVVRPLTHVARSRSEAVDWLARHGVALGRNGADAHREMDFPGSAL